MVSVTGNTITLKTGQLLVAEQGQTVTIGLVTVTQIEDAPVMKAIVINRREDVDINVDQVLTAEAGEAIYLGSEVDIKLNTVHARNDSGNAGQIRIKTGGDIINAVVDAGDVNLTGTDILLEAGKGHIGEAGNAVTVSHDSGGLIARAQDDIHITAPETDLRVESVYSQQGDVFLVADEGSIVDAIGGNGSKIVARHVSLSAVNGGIGVNGDYLEIDITSPLAAAGSTLDQGNLGTIIADAEGSIYLTETEGDMNVRGITSAEGDVGLKAVVGSIVDAEYAVPVVEIIDGVETLVVVRAGVDIIANSVRLEALIGIGGPEQELEINSSNQAEGKVNAHTASGQHLSDRDHRQSEPRPGWQRPRRARRHFHIPHRGAWQHPQRPLQFRGRQAQRHRQQDLSAGERRYRRFRQPHHQRHPESRNPGRSTAAPMCTIWAAWSWVASLKALSTRRRAAAPSTSWPRARSRSPTTILRDRRYQHHCGR